MATYYASASVLGSSTISATPVLHLRSTCNLSVNSQVYQEATPTLLAESTATLFGAANIVATSSGIRVRRIIKIDYADINKYKKPYPVGTIANASRCRG